MREQHQFKPLDPGEKISVVDYNALDAICRRCDVFTPRIERRAPGGYEIYIEVERWEDKGWRPKTVEVNHPGFRWPLLPPPDSPAYDSVSEAYDAGEAIFKRVLQSREE